MTEENPLIYLLKKYRDANWDMERVSANENVTMEFVESNLDFGWKVKYLSRNPSLTWDFVKKRVFRDWDWVELSMHRCVTPDIVERNRTMRWFWPCMSCNPNLTIEFLRKFKHRDWNWLILTKNAAFTIEMILSNRDLPWKLDFLCNNPNYKSQRKSAGNFDDLSRDPNLTIEIVKKYPVEKWSWHHVSKNEGITMKDIQENPDLPWAETVAENPNITLEYIDAHHDDPIFSFKFLSANKFTKMKERQMRIKNRKTSYPLMVKKMGKVMSRHVVETYL